MPRGFNAENFWAEHTKHKEIYLEKDKVIFFDEIDSTNSELLRRLTDCSPDNLAAMRNTLLVSATQTAGKGRMSRGFWSPRKTGIYFSFCVMPEEGVRNAADYTVCAGIAVCRAAERIFFNGKRALQIKWVNDVLFNGLKICGILTEGMAVPGSEKVSAAVIGIGINIAMPKSAPPEIASRMGGIIPEEDVARWEENNSADIRITLLSEVMHELTSIIFKKENIIKEYQIRSWLTGKTVLVKPLAGTEDSGYPAKVLGITDSAGLLVRTEDGETRELFSGEVTLH